MKKPLKSKLSKSRKPREFTWDEIKPWPWWEDPEVRFVRALEKMARENREARKRTKKKSSKTTRRAEKPQLPAEFVGKKPLRNLKPTLAAPDDEIYRIGFVVGGRRLSSFEEEPKKETEEK